MAKTKTVEHSAMFEQIKDWYGTGRWNTERVANAIIKGKITEAEYQEITGETYDG